uniref:PB1-like domain-containing protein n=1 Tax=Lactuca sativa TaxID=4236 RepID=A0A9R1XVK2_LACSA|nr:hypothetical protein LSAT_V11C200092010 [Lactuca sativa]
MTIHHGGMFIKYPGRRYVVGSIDYVDYVDMDMFSIHELNGMLKEISYNNGEPIYYHFLIPEIEIDYGLLPLGNDSDVVLEEINKPISPELNRKKFTSTEVGSCSRKLDLNENYDFSRSIVPFGHFVGDVVKDAGVQAACEKVNKVQDVGVQAISEKLGIPIDTLLEDVDPFLLHGS